MHVKIEPHDVPRHMNITLHARRQGRGICREHAPGGAGAAHGGHPAQQGGGRASQAAALHHAAPLQRNQGALPHASHAVQLVMRSDEAEESSH